MGTYNIIPSGVDTQNYTIIYDESILTINKAPLVLNNQFYSKGGSKIFEKISEALNQNKERFDVAPMNIECDECGNKFEQTLEFDAVNFFELNS